MCSNLLLVQHYCNPITVAAETVLLPNTTKEDVAAIFSNATHIMPISKTLLDSVKQRVETWTPETQLGDIFVKMVNISLIFPPESFSPLRFFDRHLSSVFTTNTKINYSIG